MVLSLRLEMGDEAQYYVLYQAVANVRNQQRSKLFKMAGDYIVDLARERLVPDKFTEQAKYFCLRDN